MTGTDGASAGSEGGSTGTDGVSAGSDGETTGPDGGTTGSGSGTTGPDGETTGSDSGATCPGNCVQDAPPGWEGPVAVYSGSFGASTPSCTGAYAEDRLVLVGSPDAGDHDCVCRCDAQGVGCSDLVVGSNGENCGGTSTAGFNGWDGVVDQACVEMPGGELPIGVVTWIGIHEAPELEGSCARVAQDNIDPVSWGGRMVACGLDQAPSQEGCGGGQLCMPEPAAAFGAGLCVYAQGADIPCPGGAYPVGTTYYQGANDTRDCTPCGSCGNLLGDCDGWLDVYKSECPAQGGAIADLVVGSKECSQVSFNAVDDLAAVGQTTVDGGTCAAPSGGQPQGTVTYTGAVTVCCG